MTTGAVPRSWDAPEWDQVADVIVVGTGAAGGAAAAAASRAGASVLILDKAEHPGGTTAASGGAMWIPGNSLLRDRGIVEDRDACIRYMARSAYPDRYRADHVTLGLPADRHAMITAFVDRAPAVIDELVADDVVELDTYHFPDYYSDLPEAVDHGRSLIPRLPPTWRRGDPGGGELLATRLRETAEARGATTRLGCEVVDLIVDDHGVIGVLARWRRSTLVLGARRGVVFGSGGFLHSPRLVQDFLRGPVFGGGAAATSTGDLVPMAARVGARLGNMSQAWWDEVVVEQAARSRHTSRDVLNVHGDSMIVVNRHGRRVMNEKAPYTDRGQAHFVWDSGRHEYPNLVTFMIFDEAVRGTDNSHLPGIHGSKLARFPVPYPDERPDYLISGDTWDELATAIDGRLTGLADTLGDIRLAPEFLSTLRETVARFDAAASIGRDPEFRRGETLIEQAWAPPSRPGAACAEMFPLAETGPYHCVILGAGALDTKGGPCTDPDGRIVTPDGTPIRGLYGAGNCVASPSGQTYWGPGTTIGLAVTFGYLAGRHAAAPPDRRLGSEPHARTT